MKTDENCEQTATQIGRFSCNRITGTKPRNRIDVSPSYLTLACCFLIASDVFPCLSNHKIQEMMGFSERDESNRFAKKGMVDRESLSKIGAHRSAG